MGRHGNLGSIDELMNSMTFQFLEFWHDIQSNYQLARILDPPYLRFEVEMKYSLLSLEHLKIFGRYKTNYYE